MRLDPADYSVISQALVAATQEMGAKLIRSAYSTIVREASDCAAAILDRDGDVVCQAELVPVQLGSMSATFRPCAERYPIATLREGDFYISNDPYNGGQHLPDIFVYSPIFVDGDVVGFAATVAHHIDVGGAAPGLNTSARELIQEGIVIPPLKLNLERDWHGGVFERLFAANIRVPHQTIGDLNAQFAGNNVGIMRVQGLCSKFSTSTVIAVMREMMNYSERILRAAISKIPDGEYHGMDFIDNDGVGGENVAISAHLEVKGDRIAIDFDGTSPNLATNINSPLASTLAAAYGCVNAVLNSADTPFNAGSIRPIQVRVPEGSLLNPTYPAPVRSRMTAVNRVFDAVMKAFAQAIPDRVIATGIDTTTGPYLSHRNRDGYRVYHEVMGGGYGAAVDGDGCSGVDGPMSNCRNAPVESLDIDFPFFRVLEYSLVPSSCGHGRFRGGLGTRKKYLILSDGVQYAQYGDRHRLRPQGLFDGLPGGNASTTLIRDGRETPLRSTEAMELRSGDILVVCTGGGGGFGKPADRDRRAVERDVRDGVITQRDAVEIYGMT